MKIWLNTPKAAKFLGRSTRHFQRAFVDSGLLPVYLFGTGLKKAHFFLVKDLEKLRTK